MSMMTQPGGRFTATNVPLTMLIRNAYDLQASQLVGLPDWAPSERFDILARTEQDIPQTTQGGDALKVMMQSLLRERFKLRAHDETRDLPAYALVLARANGKRGPQMTRSDVDCEAPAAARRAGGPPPAAGQRRPCSVRMGRGTLTAGTITMEQLGLKLDSERIPTRVLVVDSVERPTPD